MTETAEPDFDVIVIGAGIAGCVTAYQLARQGRSVLVIERGEAPGSKNLSGGVLYSRGIQQVFPGFLDEAPVERRITRNYINFLNADSSVAVDYRDARLADPVNAVTVLRAKLDPWLAERCEEAGAVIMPGVRVDRVLTEDGPAGRRIVGVRAGDDELRAHVVVAADGVNSFIAKEAGLRKQEPLNHLAVGVKSVVSLPRETIEARFNLTGNEGAAIAAVGDCTEGVGQLLDHGQVFPGLETAADADHPLGRAQIHLVEAGHPGLDHLHAERRDGDLLDGHAAATGRRHGTAVEQQGYRAGDRDSLVGYVAEHRVDHDDALAVEGHRPRPGQDGRPQPGRDGAEQDPLGGIAAAEHDAGRIGRDRVGHRRGAGFDGSVIRRAAPDHLVHAACRHGLGYRPGSGHDRPDLPAQGACDRDQVADRWLIPDDDPGIQAHCRVLSPVLASRYRMALIGLRPRATQ